MANSKLFTASSFESIRSSPCDVITTTEMSGLEKLLGSFLFVNVVRNCAFVNCTGVYLSMCTIVYLLMCICVFPRCKTPDFSFAKLHICKIYKLLQMHEVFSDMKGCGIFVRGKVGITFTQSFLSLFEIWLDKGEWRQDNFLRMQLDPSKKSPLFLAPGYKVAKQLKGGCQIHLHRT